MQISESTNVLSNKTHERQQQRNASVVPPCPASSDEGLFLAYWAFFRLDMEYHFDVSPCEVFYGECLYLLVFCTSCEELSNHRVSRFSLAPIVSRDMMRQASSQFVNFSCRRLRGNSSNRKELNCGATLKGIPIETSTLWICLFVLVFFN